MTRNRREFPVAGGVMTDFAFSNALAVLAAKEMEAARKDPERMGVMIERLSACLGFTIACAAKGDPKAIDEFIIGATDYAHREAVDKAPFAAMIEGAIRP